MGEPLKLSDTFHLATMEGAMFHADTVYSAEDVVARGIANYSTLAKWRHAKIGPPYIRLGKRVGYRGRDLNDWIESRTIRPSAA